MKLSIVIPAYNEEGSIAATVNALTERLDAEPIPYEVVVVDDNSTDRTRAIVDGLAATNTSVRCVPNDGPNGFGFAVRAGLQAYTGDAVAIVMADLSDDPEDVVTYYRLLESGYDCAFGSRFVEGSQVIDYPPAKLRMNRLVNWGIRVLFGHRYNDTTNAFKAYRREVIDSVQPLLSNHFNLTVEIPLKAIVRGHSYAVTPIRWTNRQSGESKLKLQEMGSRYAYIVLMIFLEHHLSRGDYRHPDAAPNSRRWRAGHPGTLPSQDNQPIEGPRR